MAEFSLGFLACAVLWIISKLATPSCEWEERLEEVENDVGELYESVTDLIEAIREQDWGGE